MNPALRHFAFKHARTAVLARIAACAPPVACEIALQGGTISEGGGLD